MQQFLKPTAGSAWAQVIPVELLDEFLVADKPQASFDSGFRIESHYVVCS
jgi:hypothetical protein